MRAAWRTLDRGTVRDIGLVCLADAVVGASFGAVSVSGGLPEWVPVAMSVLVFAGGAQFAAVGVVLAGGGAAAGVAAGLVLNSRMLPYGLAVADVLGDRWRTRVPGAHLIVDETVAFALRHRDPDRSRAAFWACGLALFGCWVLATVLGTLAGHVISDPGRFGLDAVFPAVLLALVLPSLSDRGTRRAALLGAAGAVAVTPFLPPGLPVLLALAGLVVAGRPGREAGHAGTGTGHAGPAGEQVWPEAGHAGPEASQVRPEAGQVRPEAGHAGPEASQVRPEANQVRPGAGQVRPGESQARPGAGRAGTAGEPMRSGAGLVRPGAGQVRPGASQVRPGAGQAGPAGEPMRSGTGQVRPEAGQVRPGGAQAGREARQADLEAAGQQPDARHGGLRPPDARQEAVPRRRAGAGDEAELRLGADRARGEI